MRLTPAFLAHMRAAAEQRREAMVRIAQAQRRHTRKRIAAGCWRVGRAERER